MPVHVFSEALRKQVIKMCLKQSLITGSIRNARELGGYCTEDGRTIKKGLLLRSAALCGISDDDVRLLTNTYHLQHIIDFRMNMELVNAGDPAMDGVKYHHYDVLSSLDLDNNEKPDIDIKSLDLAKTTRLAVSAGMLRDNMYIGFLTSESGKKAFAGFFQILLSADSDRAVLWHCTGGKDRTGVAAMLLLSVLGADEEAIVSDYLLTNAYNAQSIADTQKRLKAQGYDDAFIGKAVLVFDGVDESYMRNATAFLKKEYGSAAEYIRTELNISNSEINLLKEKYLL